MRDSTHLVLFAGEKPMERRSSNLASGGSGKSDHAGSTETVFLVICVIGFFAILSSTMSKSPVLPYFASYLQTPKEFWLGLVSSASTIPGIIISLPAGSLSDILGRRKMLLISTIIFASAPFLYLFINVWWELILVRFYHGFATGMFVPVAQALIVEKFPTKRGERISLFSAVTVVGRSIAPLLGGFILFATNPGVIPEEQTYSNYGALYLAVGIAGLAALILALPLLRQKMQEHGGTEPRRGLKGILRLWRTVALTPGVLTVGVVEAGQYYTYGSVEYYFALYMGKVANINTLLQGVILAATLFVVVLSKPLVGRLSDRAGRRAPVILGCSVSIFPLVLIPFFRDFAALLVLSMIYGLGFSVVTSVTPALVSDLVPLGDVGSAMGVISTLMDIGQAAGPIICSIILVSILGYVGLFVSLAIVLGITMVIFALSKTGERK